MVVQSESRSASYYRLRRKRRSRESRQRKIRFFGLLGCVAIAVSVGVCSWAVSSGALAVGDGLLAAGDSSSSSSYSYDERIAWCDFPELFQTDSRWSDVEYAGSTIELSGCGPTCLSMVYVALTGDTSQTPVTVAEMSTLYGFAVEDSGSSWELMTTGAEALGLQAEELSLSESVIVEALENGQPIIAVVGPGEFTDEGHFIVLAGITDDGQIIVHDPNSSDNTETLWDIDVFLSETKDLWAYTA